MVMSFIGFIISIVSSILCFLYWFDFSNIRIDNVIMTLVIVLGMFIVFGIIICFRGFIKQYSSYKAVQNDRIIIEEDTIIDKYSYGDGWYIQLEYAGKQSVFSNQWKELKVKDKCYVVYVSEKDRQLWRLKSYILDEELMKCLCKTHQNERHLSEPWE